MSSKIPLAGVIGSPIAHSRSPKMHQHWLKTLGLSGYYIPMDVAHEDLQQALKTLPRLGFVGVNVTIPHKEAVLALASTVSDRAALIGAANTLTFLPDGSIYADNTDGYGFIANLRAGAPDWAANSGPCALFGAGGASRAVITALLEAGTPVIRLSNRSRPRAEALKREFGSRIEVYDWVRAAESVNGATLVVNATSLGMDGRPELKIPLNTVASNAVVTDLVYTPLMTSLLRAAQEASLQIVDGLGMLMHQGTPGFERWFGMRPDVDEETRRVILQA